MITSDYQFTRNGRRHNNYGLTYEHIQIFHETEGSTSVTVKRLYAIRPAPDRLQRIGCVRADTPDRQGHREDTKALAVIPSPRVRAAEHGWPISQLRCQFRQGYRNPSINEKYRKDIEV